MAFSRFTNPFCANPTSLLLSYRANSAMTRSFRSVGSGSVLLCSNRSFSSDSNPSSKANRFQNVAANFTVKPRPAPFFNGMFESRMAMANQFEQNLSGRVVNDAKSFTEYWSQIRAYIFGLDQLSKYEMTSIAAAAVAWFPWDNDKETEVKMDSELTAERADELLSTLKDTHPLMARKAILLSGLSASSASKLNDEEYAELVRVAKKLALDKQSAKRIRSIHSLELRLKEEYKWLYGIK